MKTDTKSCPRQKQEEEEREGGDEEEDEYEADEDEESCWTRQTDMRREMR